MTTWLTSPLIIDESYNGQRLDLDLALARDFSRKGGDDSLRGAVQIRGARLLTGRIRLRGYETLALDNGRQYGNWHEDPLGAYDTGLHALCGVHLYGTAGCDLELDIAGFPGDGIISQGGWWNTFRPRISRCFYGLRFDHHPAKDYNGRTNYHCKVVDPLTRDLWAAYGLPHTEKAVSLGRSDPALAAGGDGIVGRCDRLEILGGGHLGDGVGPIKISGRGVLIKGWQGPHINLAGPSPEDTAQDARHTPSLGIVVEDCALVEQAVNFRVPPLLWVAGQFEDAIQFRRTVFSRFGDWGRNPTRRRVAQINWAHVDFEDCDFLGFGPPPPWESKEAEYLERLFQLSGPNPELGYERPGSINADFFERNHFERRYPA